MEIHPRNTNLQKIYNFYFFHIIIIKHWHQDDHSDHGLQVLHQF